MLCLCLFCVRMCILTHAHFIHTRDMAACLQLPSNQSFYRQIANYRTSVDVHRVAWWWKGITDKQTNYMRCTQVQLCISCTPINVMWLLSVFFPGSFSIATTHAFNICISLMWWPKWLMWSQTSPSHAHPLCLIFFLGRTLTILWHTLCIL